MKKLILLLFLLSVTTLQANDLLIRKIDNISYRSLNGATIGLIKLTDGSVWKWLPDMYSETLLRNWAEGDKIVIEVANCPGFILNNLSKPHFSPMVALSFNSYTIFPAISRYDKENNSIVLNDGSKWELIDGFNKRTLYHWTAGDRVIPVRGPYENYQLINLDIPFENQAQIERHVEVSPQMLPQTTRAIAECSLLPQHEYEAQTS